MPIPNVSTLYTRIKKGSEGGLEFARIMNQFLVADSKSNGNTYTATSDASGDYKGVDGILTTSDNKKIGFQFKFYPSPLNSNHRSSILSSFQNAKKQFPEMDIFILITPEDLERRSMEWFEGKLKDELCEVHHWGHTYIVDLALKHMHIGERYFPELKLNIPLELPEPEAEKFFLRMTESKEAAMSIMLSAQPNLSDCKAVFSSPYSLLMHDIYHALYRMAFLSDEPYKIVEKNRVQINSNTITDIRNSKDSLPGGMRHISAEYNAFNAGTRFYHVHYLKDEAEYGIGQSIWCFVNGRWVFFPKPWRIIRELESTKNSKEFKRLTKILRVFGLKDVFKNQNPTGFTVLMTLLEEEFKNK